MSRILIVKNYGIGNQIMATPLLRALHSLGHEVIVLSEYVGTEAIAGMPAIAALAQWFPADPDHSHRMEQVIQHRVQPEIAIASVPVHGDSQNRFLACAPVIMNYGKIEQWMRHEADVNLDYARELGWTGDWESCEFFIPDDVEAGVEKERVALDPGRPIVGFHFGCIKSWTWVYKRWHLERFIDVAWKLHDETGCYILLVGGPMERDEADQFKFSLDEHIQPFVIDKVKQVSLKASGAWIRQADVFVSNDSGPMHMAAAVGTPVVAVFGMSNPVKNAPWVEPGSGRASVITTDIWCRPCFGTHRHGMCERGDCLADITVDRVYGEALRYLKT